MRNMKTRIRVVCAILICSLLMLAPFGSLSGSLAYQSDLPTLEIVSCRFIAKVQGKYPFGNTAVTWEPAEPGDRTGLVVTIVNTSPSEFTLHPQKLLLLYTIGSFSFEQKCIAICSAKSKEPEDGKWKFIYSPSSNLLSTSVRPDETYIHLLFEVGKKAEQGTEVTVAFIGPVLKSKPINVKEKLNQ